MTRRVRIIPGQKLSLTRWFSHTEDYSCPLNLEKLAAHNAPLYLSGCFVPRQNRGKFCEARSSVIRLFIIHAQAARARASKRRFPNTIFLTSVDRHTTPRL